MENVVPTEMQAEIRQRLEEGKNNGETEVQILSRMIWSERLINQILLAALEEISRTVSAPDCDSPSPKKSNIIQMKSGAHTA